MGAPRVICQPSHTAALGSHCWATQFQFAGHHDLGSATWTGIVGGLCGQALRLVCYRIKTENIGEPRSRSLFSILPVISLWHAGGGGSRERKLENPHYVGKWLSINKVRGMIKWDWTVLCPHSLGVSFLDLKAERASGRPFTFRNQSAGVAPTLPLFSRGHT